MAMEQYDLCVIGAGPAGFAAAMRAHDLGKRVALIEKGRIGGAGIHHGALSSKTMWHLANDYEIAHRVDRGYQAREVDVAYAEVCRVVDAAVAEREALLEQQLVQLALPHREHGGVVHLLRGAARFESPHRVAVTDGQGAVSSVQADHFLIATGSRPRIPAEIPVDGHTVVTSDQIHSFTEFPQSMVIVGAGVIGCEYATIFANFRRTKIHIIDRHPRVLPFEDEDVSEEVTRNFEAMGIVVHRAARLESLAVEDGKVVYVIKTASGERETIRVDKALVAVGRIANTADLGLERTGVQFDAQGGLLMQNTRTTVPHIYAAGDATMDIALLNIAELEGRHAVEAMFGLAPRAIVYEALSTIMFLKPEVATVGLNETMARAQQVPYRVAVLDNRLVSRNTAMRETRGFVKLLVAQDSGTILGIRALGPQASSAIQGIAFLISMDATLGQLDRCVHPHPAIPEGVQECARLLLGRSILKPEVFVPKGLMRIGDG
jgi:dihydrolipoamide dehydrogenase